MYGYKIEQQRVKDWTLLTPFYNDPKKYAVLLQEQILSTYSESWNKHQNSQEIVFLEGEIII